MKITYGKCKHCKDIIFSFYTHDYKTCKCGKSSLDGGFDYIRIIGDLETKQEDIKNCIKDIRESFKWGRNYDKEGNKLLFTDYILLKYLETDHIIGILKYFTERIESTQSISKEWKAKHIIFLEELSYRLENKIY